MIISSDLLDKPLDDALAPDADVEIRDFEFGTALHGKRLDQALATLVPEFSRSYLQRLIEDGAVTVSRRVLTKPSQRVLAGTSGRVEMRPTEQSQAFRPEAMPLDVIYLDEDLMVVNKPSGLVVHPAPGNWTGTLLNGLLAFDGKASTLPRAGIVHRLDKDTSGLMVVARSRIAMEGLVREIAARDVSRQYLCVTDKPWRGSARQFDVDQAIGRDPANRLRMAVVDEARHPGKPAKSTLRCVATSADATLVLCTLHTGRTHQIRVHMSSQGMPLIGDAVYGGNQQLGMHRQALHAWKLAFLHPVTQAPMRFELPLPVDMIDLCLQLGLRYNPKQLVDQPE